MFICFFLLAGIILYSNNKPKNSKLMNNKENKYSGYDYRPFDNKSEVDINVIRNYFFKKDLLHLLQSDSINYNQKILMIYKVALFDDINPYVISAPNLTKGLKW
jgi:hypothetical protein